MASCFRPHILGLLVAIVLLSIAGIAVPPPQAQNQNREADPHPLPWAYAVVPAPTPAPPVTDDGTLRRVPGSTQAFTLAQLRDNANPVDWFPEDHPAIPAIVAHRRSPTTTPWIGGCGLCHYINGKGRPENASVTGLPVAYFLEQIADFRSGARRTADPGKANTAIMAGNASGITDEEAFAAAEYFSSIKMTPWIKVVETETVPKSRNSGGFFVPLEGNAGLEVGNGKDTEPIGRRIMEMPADTEASELYRNPRSGWIAYVPVGSVKKGEDLAVNGSAGKTVACAACHGEGLKGSGNVPPLAGRSPSYLARQLYDIQHFTRNGPGAALMRPVVKNLSQDDILVITAYIASLQP